VAHVEDVQLTLQWHLKGWTNSIIFCHGLISLNIFSNTVKLQLNLPCELLIKYFTNALALFDILMQHFHLPEHFFSREHLFAIRFGIILQIITNDLIII